MEILHYILLGIFLVSTILGYILIKNVPSLLHTPLMSGMNALSGITLIGGLLALAITSQVDAVSTFAAGLSVIAATINVFGGFGVTHRMLMMFKKREKEDE